MSVAKIIDKILSLHKKIGKAKFNEIVPPKKIEAAKKVESRMVTAFKEAVADDFKVMQRIYEKLTAENITKRDYAKINDIAFKIKSRAGNAGHMVASKIANSLFVFADFVTSTEAEVKGYDVVRMHFVALGDILSGKFDASNDALADKLVKGLEALCDKARKPFEKPNN